MAARICPQCRTRVDERRARTSPYCLTCGAPLGTAPPTSYGTAPAKASALPWILGGIGAFLLVGVGGVVILMVAVSGKGEKQTRSFEADPNGLPPVETATATPPIPVPPPRLAPTPKIATTTPKPTAAPTPVVTAPPVTPVTLGAFPRAQANNEVDRVTSGLGTCKRAGDPTGGGTVRVDFEPDGRVTPTVGRPFAGTPTGACVASRYLAIRVGAFQGTTQTLSRSFAISAGSGKPSTPF